ncbi:hypothetical protein AYO47_01265 [Planctomyces sp. SCGC AG-212-M04]|nr:hypothetical protein AYO47_01265 [Planctomyces sp. SCGC AG-212-M04]
MARLFAQQPRMRRTRRHFRGCFTVQALEARILLDGEEDPPYDPPPAAADDYFFAGDYNQLSDYQDTVAGNDDYEVGDRFSVLSDPEYGTLDMQSDGSFTYTPDGEHPGLFSFTYQIDDGVNTPSEATAWLELYNPPPEANEDVGYFSLDQGTMTIDAAHGLLVNDSLDSRESNTASLWEQPDYGSASVSSDGSFTYTPDPEYLGEVSFIYKLSDGKGGEAFAEVKIEVGKVTVERCTEYQGDVWIGEYIPLQAVVTGGTGGNVGAMTYSWSLSGQTLKDYVNDYFTASDGSSQPRAYPLPLSAADLASEYITFGWTSDGAQTATVTVSLNGQTSTGQIEINVQKPTFDYYADMGGINLNNLTQQQGGRSGASLGTINPYQAGIVFWAPFDTWNPDPRQVGSMGLIQTGAFSASRTLADGTVQEISASGADNGGDHDAAGNDAPSLKLMPNARSYSVEYSFDTYLKWKGPRPGFWVGVSVVHWWFSYEATSADGITWTLTSTSGTLNQRIDGVDGIYFPTYAGDIAWAAGGQTNDHDLGGWGTPD